MAMINPPLDKLDFGVSRVPLGRERLSNLPPELVEGWRVGAGRL